MVKVQEDMTGWKMWEHGVPDSRLTVIAQAEDYVSPNGERKSRWLCECGCEQHNRIVATGRAIKTGNTKSCGCLLKDKMIETGYKHKKYNRYDLSGEYGIGWTTNTNKEFYFDLEDYDKIKDYCWYEQVNHNGYHCLMAKNNETNKLIKMHQLVFNKFCDHRNREPFDNRKANLRDATYTQNSQNRSIGTNNTSGVVGVGWYQRYAQWRARITVNDTPILLGYFDNKIDAIRARLEAEKKYFKEFAPQQHLFKQYGV